MPKCECPCGATYIVAEEAVGKKARCKKCGVVFKLEPADDGIIPFADEAPGVSQDASSAANDTGGGSSTPFDPSTLPPPIIEPPSTSPDEATEGATTYPAGIAAAFFFLKSARNAITFVVLWVAFFVVSLLLSWGAMLSLFTLIVYWGLKGWWAAYRFNVVASGAAGDDDLPDLAMPGEGLSGLLMTGLKWIGTWVIVLMPAVVFTVVAAVQGWIDPDALSNAIDEGVVALLFSDTGGGAPVLAGLVALGMFVWPIVILCVALGGFRSVGSVGLIGRTIAKTFPVYLLTVVMVFGTDILRYFLTASVETRLSAGEGPDSAVSFGSAAAISFLGTGITLYSEIVAMKLIGLYYHHFKDRFAWDWG